MDKKYLMGIDIGTSRSKGVITTFQGELVGTAEVSHGTGKKSPGFFEQDPEKVWFRDFTYLTRGLLRKAPIRPEEVLSVGISAMGPCVVAADEGGNPLREGILYGIDTRAGAQIERLERKYGKEYFPDHCGQVLSSQSAGPKILWIKENEREVFDKTKMFMSAASYIGYRLTGKNVMDFYTACAGFTPLFDFGSMCWDEDMCLEFGCLGKLPALQWTGEMGGRVTRKASAQTGLSAGTIVNTGTCDAAAEALSVGVAGPGKTMLMLGSTAFMIMALDKPVKEPCLWSAPYLFPGSYSLLGGMSAAGLLTEWYMEQCGEMYDSLIQGAEKISPGSDGLLVLPYFCGERTPVFDSDAKGVFFGLNLNHTRHHLYRSLLEGTAYGIRDNLAVFARYEGKRNEIVTVGGGCKNPLWLQIISDVTGREQSLSAVTLGAAYGDAFLGGLAAGAIDNEHEIKNWVTEAGHICPAQANREMYDFHFSLYKELYRNTAPLMKRL